MPKDQLIDENLIQIITPDKTVNGLTWEQFHKALEEKGYPDPEHDNHLRAIFNMSGDDHPEITFHAEQILGYEGAYDAGFHEKSEERFLQIIEEEILNPARMGQDYAFDESERETILYCQTALNESGKGINEYAFDEYNRRPDEAEREAREREEREERERQEREERERQEREERERQEREERERQEREAREREEREAREREEREAREREEREERERQEREERERQEREERERQEREAQERQEQEPQKEEPQKEEPQKEEPQKEEAKKEEPKKEEPKKEEPQKEAELAKDLIDRDYGKMYMDMQDVYDRLEDEEVGVHFGSDEYEKAKKDCQKIKDAWEKIQEKGPDYHMSNYEIDQMRQQMEEATESMDAYIAKKQREEAQKGELSTKSFYRVEAMRSAKRKMQAQIAAMEELAVERGMEQPVPSAKQLEQQRRDIFSEIEDAQVGVHMGSKEYDTAQKEFENLNDLWSTTMIIKKSEDELPTPGEIETLRATIDRTRNSVDDYLLKKADLNDPSPKTQKRITAMNRAKENLEIQTKKLEEMEKKLLEQEPEKSLQTLAEDTEYLKDQMEAADKGVHFGSDEYKEVWKLLEQQEKKWKELAEKGPDYKMSPEELKEMVELNQKMEKAANKYIQNKAGEELSPKTQKRLRTIQKVKNHALSQRKKFEVRKDEMLKEVEGISHQEMEDRSRNVSREIRNADRKVYFGSKEYANAMKTYNRSLDRWEQYKEKEEKGIATPKERETEKKALESNIKEIDKYLDKKKKKNLDKNPKMKKRVETMQKAKRNMELRIQKIEAAEKKLKQAEKEQRRQQLQDRKNNLKLGAKSQQALDRSMSRCSLSATSQLSQLGTRKTLTEIDKRNARTALAAIVLEDKLKQPGNEPLKKALSKNGKTYAKEVKKLANSKEFREAFPDSTFTPANCKNFAKDPRIVQRCAKEFNNRMVQKQQIKLQKQQQKQKELNKQKEIKN